MGLSSGSALVLRARSFATALALLLTCTGTPTPAPAFLPAGQRSCCASCAALQTWAAAPTQPGCCALRGLHGRPQSRTASTRRVLGSCCGRLTAFRTARCRPPRSCRLTSLPGCRPARRRPPLPPPPPLEVVPLQKLQPSLWRASGLRGWEEERRAAGLGPGRNAPGLAFECHKRGCVVAS